MGIQPTKIRPPVVDDYDNKNQRQVRTAIQQLTGAGSGRILSQQLLTSASGVYTRTPGTTSIYMEITGGGGGGGGAAGGANVACGGGGGSGVTLKVTITGTGEIVGGPYSCGAAGAGGANTGATGGSGGSTTIQINGTTYTAAGGGGGQGMASSTSANARGGIPQSGSSSGFIAAGSIGITGINRASVTLAGDGGSGLAGVGGAAAINTNAAGGNASGFGAGGGGANAAATGFAGGNGSAGCIFIEERA